MANDRRETVNGRQQCSKCGEWKKLDDYYCAKRYANGREPSCKACVKKAHAPYYSTPEYLEKNRERMRLERTGYIESVKEREWKKDATGISFEQYLKDSENGCHMCGSKELRRGDKFLCVDHNHKTGAYRGILCWKCNILLGQVHDDIQACEAFMVLAKNGIKTASTINLDKLDKCAEYLKKHQQER